MTDQAGRPYHRPMTPGDRFFEAIEAGADPAAVAEAADRAAAIIVRGARDADQEVVGERLLHLAETEGIETIAEVWSGAPADSLAGCLWRLYLLRQWVYADPVGVAHQFEAGRAHAPVAGAVAGVADPPGPDELKTMIDHVLRGIAVSDFADVLFRAAAFAHVVATGRAVLDVPAAEASRMRTLADQLEAAARQELAQQLGLNLWGRFPAFTADGLNSGRVPGRGSPGSQLQPPRAALRREALPVRHTTSLLGCP